jgi:4-amino-4-deoxy-L-arabinose transferase-like glycosyltransferase
VRERANPAVRLLVIWIAVIVIFFSLSGTKEDLYILPVVTAEAALIGAMITACLRKGRQHAIKWASLVTAALLVVTGGALFWMFGISHRYSLQGAGFVGAAAVAAGSVAAIAASRDRIFGAIATIAGAMVVTAWCVVLCSLPDFERYKPVRPFADIIRSRASEGGIVGYYKFALPSMVFYLNRPTMEVVLPDHLRAVFYSSGDVHFVMPEADYQQIRDRLPSKTYVLARRPMFDLRPKNFLEGSELPQFVLISNRPGDASSQ